MTITPFRQTKIKNQYLLVSGPTIDRQYHALLSPRQVTELDRIPLQLPIRNQYGIYEGNALITSRPTPLDAALVISLNKLERTLLLHTGFFDRDVTDGVLTLEIPADYEPIVA